MPDTPDDVPRLRDWSSLASQIDSIVKTNNRNMTEVLQRLTASESWQESYEKRDSERWETFNRNWSEKWGEIKGMLETIPVKVANDFAVANSRIDKLEKALVFWRGAWFAVTVAAGLVEFYLHSKGV